jgi:hypothetical protein
MTARLWTICILLLIRRTLTLDAALQRIKESPGLYYDHIGEATLYNTEWKLVTYINSDDADNLEEVKKYSSMTVNFCKKNDRTFWVKFTDCLKSIKFVDR